MPVTVRVAEQRRTETPNATMTTLASPTLGPTAGLSLWAVAMTAGAVGPLHAFDREQVWTLVEGEATVEVDGDPVDLTVGDTLVLAPAVPRRVHAGTDARFVVCGAGDATASVIGEDESRGVPPWIA
jgi:quercetin dioxygenase-like cupin family protein